MICFESSTENTHTLGVFSYYFYTMLNIAYTVKIVLFRILIMKLITYFYRILVSSIENLHFNTEMCR